MPMMAYRFVSTMEFRAESMSMKNFPFDKHELKIVARSREAEEIRNKNVEVRLQENEKVKSTMIGAEKFSASDAWDFAVERDAKHKGKTYMRVKINPEKQKGGRHDGRTFQYFTVGFRIQRRSKDWMIQVGEGEGSRRVAKTVSIKFHQKCMKVTSESTESS